MRPRTLTQKLLLGVLPLVLLFLLAVGFGAYALARIRILESTQRDVDSIAGRMASEFRSFFSQRVQDIDQLTEVPLFAECFFAFDMGLREMAERHLKEIDKYLVRFARRARVYERVSFLDGKGRELSAVEWGRAAPEKRTRPPEFLGQLLKGRRWVSGIQAGASGPSRIYGAPLSDPSGRIRGAIVLECALEPILRGMNRDYVATRGGATLESDSGQTVLGSRPAIEKPLIGRAPIADTPWNLVVATDPAPYLAPLKDFGRWMALLALLTGVLSTLLVAWRIGRALKPLERMQEGTRRLAAGDLAYRFEEPDTAELKSLAGEFNELARNLQGRNKELEDRIGELTELHANLDETEARYKTVLDNSPAAVLGLSRQHHITTWNRGAQQIFGYTSAEILGKPLASLFPPGAEAEFRKLLLEVRSKGGVRDWPMSGRTKGGRLLELSLSWAGARKEYRLNREWSVVIRDETEARSLQRQVLQSEKLSAMGRLIAGIAHDLNNPLQNVMGYAELLSRRQQAASPEDLRRIHENARRCCRIIENLLLFVRQGKVVKRPVRLEQVVRASLELLDYKLSKAADIQVELRLPEELPRVRADFQQLEQVFVNLINNAYDALAGAAGPRRLRIQAKSVDRKVRVEVADSGPGVPEELRELLFKPFFTTKSEGQGTGLGLAICRQIVEEHDGRIGFESNGGSTTFWLELPAAPAGEKPLGEAISGPAPSRGKSVLLIDDDPDILSLVRRDLEEEGYRVTAAASGLEAEGAASRGGFDLVLSDIHLGSWSGLALYDEWGRRFSGPRPLFLFLTGDVLNAALSRSVEERRVPILYKPVNLEALHRAVNGLLVRRAA